MQTDRTKNAIKIDSHLFAIWVQGELAKKSQNNLAKSLDVSSQTVIRWKQGDVKQLYEETLQGIADYRQVSLQQVIQEFGCEEKKTITNPIGIQEIIRQIEGLSPHELVIISRVATERLAAIAESATA